MWSHLDREVQVLPFGVPFIGGRLDPFFILKEGHFEYIRFRDRLELHG